MPDEPIDWSAFHRQALARPPRELLRRTLGFFAVEGRLPGIAIDLGCGSGADSLELLRRGWTVHAVDSSAPALQLLQSTTDPAWRSRLHLHAEPFERWTFPDADLVWASYSLPFCPAPAWPGLWARALAALRPGGRIAGDLFGVRHGFGDEGGVLLLTETDARALLHGLDLEAFDIEDGRRPSSGTIVRWHAFGFAAHKPAADVADPTPSP